MRSSVRELSTAEKVVKDELTPRNIPAHIFSLKIFLILSKFESGDSRIGILPSFGKMPAKSEQNLSDTKKKKGGKKLTRV